MSGRGRLPVWTAVGVTAAMALGGVSFAASTPGSVPAAPHGPGGPGRGGMQGVITAINGGVLTLRRQGPGGSGTLTVDTSGSTTFQEGGPGAKSGTLTLSQLRVGERIAVQGTLSGSTVSAATVAVQPAPPLSGVITAINGGVLTLQRQGPGGGGTLTVDTSGSTTFQEGGPGATSGTLTLSQLRVGERIAVQGTLSGTTVTARTVRLQPAPGRGPAKAGPHPGGPGRGGLQGMITAINGGVLTLRRQGPGPGGSGTLTVDTSGSTTFQEGGPGVKTGTLTLSQLRVGERIAVQGTLSGSTVSATTVAVQPAPPLSGVITAINGGVLTLQRQGPGGSGTLTVDTSGSTSFQERGPGAKTGTLALSQLRVGERVAVRGARSGSTVSATVVAVLPAGPKPGRPPLSGVGH